MHCGTAVHLHARSQSQLAEPLGHPRGQQLARQKRPPHECRALLCLAQLPGPGVRETAQVLTAGLVALLAYGTAVLSLTERLDPAMPHPPCVPCMSVREGQDLISGDGLRAAAGTDVGIPALVRCICRSSPARRVTRMTRMALHSSSTSLGGQHSFSASPGCTLNQQSLEQHTVMSVDKQHC